jgi:hypothetical protein
MFGVTSAAASDEQEDQHRGKPESTHGDLLGSGETRPDRYERRFYPTPGQTLQSKAILALGSGPGWNAYTSMCVAGLFVT